jgi:hypothetical protein
MTKSIEPIVLAVFLALLAIGTAILAYEYPSVADITGVTTLDPKGHGSKKIDPADVDSSLIAWDTPAMWQEPETHHRLFHSDEYLFYPSAYPDGNYISKITKDTKSPSGVLLSWYRKYNLDFTDPNVDREDPDNDGFSNLAEYKNEPEGVRLKAADCDGTKTTDPLDGKSHPSYLGRLRLQKYETRPFHVQFKGYQQLNGISVFQIYLNDVPSSNQPPLLKTGDKLGFEGYIVGPFHQAFEEQTDPGTGLKSQVDVSTLELDKPDIDLKVSVPFRKIIDSPEATADFVMLMPSEVDKVIKVSRGKVFSAPYLPDNSYLVIKADDDGAVIRDVKTKEDHHILKLDPAEWDEVPVPAATDTSTPK